MELYGEKRRVISRKLFTRSPLPTECEMNYANNKKAFLFIFVSIILSLMALIFARYFHEKYYSRIHSFDSVNYNRIDQIKYGFMHYEGGKHYESGKHYATASLSTEGSAKPLSWRVQLLPFFDEKNYMTKYFITKNSINLKTLCSKPHITIGAFLLGIPRKHQHHFLCSHHCLSFNYQ